MLNTLLEDIVPGMASVLCLSAAYFILRSIKDVPEGRRWVKAVMAVCLLYFGIMYVLFTFDYFADCVDFTRVYMRPVLLVFLTCIVSNEGMRAWRK